MQHLGRRMKELRCKHGMTLKSLGEAVDFNYSNLSKIERGIRKPKVELLDRIANYFNVDISYFFNGEEGDIGSEESLHHDLYMLTREIKNKNISVEELRMLAETISKIK
jgi:transcriptional regulator with XRE-family HTH domain